MSDRPMVNVYEGDPERLLYRPMNDAEHEQYLADQEAATAAQQAASARAWVELRMRRDRYLAQIQPILDEAAVPGSHPSFPQHIVDAVAANAADWNAYAQALRDLPENTVDPTVAAWPEMPAAPIVHLT